MDNIEDINQKTWESWKSESGNCSGCPNHHKEFTPFYGVGSRNADLAIVAEGPRHQSDKDKSVNIPEKHRDKVASSYCLGEILVQSPGGIRRIPKEFFDRLNLPVELESHFEGSIYYTNARRCAGSKTTNNDALEKCKGYLSPELEAVNPSVVLLIGKDATRAVFSEFDMELGKFGEEVRQVHGDSRPYLIPMYHWGYTKRLGKERHLEYWMDAVKTVNEYLE